MVGDWRKSSAVKSSCCSYGGPKLGSQSPAYNVLALYGYLHTYTHKSNKSINFPKEMKKWTVTDKPKVVLWSHTCSPHTSEVWGSGRAEAVERTKHPLPHKRWGQLWGWSTQGAEVQGRRAAFLWSRRPSTCRSGEVQAGKHLADNKEETLQTTAHLDKPTFTNTDILSRALVVDTVSL